MNSLSKIPNEEAFLDLIPPRVRLARKDKFTAWMGSGGNFSFVLLERGGEKFIGVAKRNPADKEAGETGLQIAAVRAYRAMIGQDEGYARQHPITKRQAKRIAACDLLVKVLDRADN